MACAKTFLVILSLIAACNYVTGQNILTKLEQGVQEILEHLRERDRLDQQKEQDTLGLLNMDSTLRKIEQRTDDIAQQLRMASGRSGAVAGEVQNLEVRIDTLEDNVVSNVKGSVQKIEDVKRQTDSIKSEMEKRLGKMMNVMTQVHKDLREKVASKPETTENEESQTNFMSEELDDLKNKVQESLSITTQSLVSSIQGLKTELLDPFLECKNLGEQVEDMKSKCESATFSETTTSESKDSHNWLASTNQEDLVREITSSVMRNLSRVQREITDSINKRMQDIENTILTGQATKQPVDTKISPPSKYEAATKPEEISYRTPEPTTSTTAKPTAVPTPTSRVRPNEPADCKTLRYEVPKPHSCYDLKQAGASCNGPYVIYPNGVKAVYAYCDMTTDGGGWTVLMRRGELGHAPVNFDQSWEGYKTGFGDINGEFWLGNENIRLLTSGQQTMTLNVMLEGFDGSRIDIVFDQFWIESEENKYRLHLGDVNRSQAYHASSLRHHNGRAFTTYDRNNEEDGSQNCAVRYRGGWWYNRCHYALLTAPRFNQNQFRHKWQGMQWHAWKGNDVIKGAEMRIRPKTV